MTANPITLVQLEDLLAVQTAFRRLVQVFRGCLNREPGCMQSTPNMVIQPAGAFLIHQERQTLFKSQVDVLRVVLLLTQSITESGQTQLEQLVEKNGIGHE